MSWKTIPNEPRPGTARGAARALGLAILAALTTVAAAAAQEAAPAESPREWRHLSMDDLSPEIDAFRPTRAKYLQRIYDLEGNETVDFSSLVQIDIDRTVHSGPWDGTAPLVLEPFREPGLVITWLVQNALYVAFDRVLTDGRLSMVHRIMPGGTRDLLIGFMDGDELTRIDAAPPDSGGPMRVHRTTLPEGSVNVLTIPYVLASMDLEAGDRFTLPGYALIGGPDGIGVAYRLAVWVRSTPEVRVGGETRRVAEVYVARVDPSDGSLPDFTEPDRRFTRHIVSDEAPYLLGRASMTRGEDGATRFVREYLGLVDWAELPLPPSANARLELWDLDTEAAEMRLDPSREPDVLVPLRPEVGPGASR